MSHCAKTPDDSGGVLVVTGTGTGVGKTVVTAAVAALAVAAGRSVAVVKPAQTGVAGGEPGDVDVIRRLAGVPTAVELARYPYPLAPATAARLAGMPAVAVPAVVQAVRGLAAEHDLVLVEGAGGLLVRFDDAGGTVADVAAALDAPVLVTVAAGLGTLNVTALTAEALRARGVRCAGIVIGEWPAEPDLADRCNLLDLPEAADAPLLGALPAGAGAADARTFLGLARGGLAPALGGALEVRRFVSAGAASAPAITAD